MPRLNMYEQQTVAQGPRASGAEFGSGVGQAVMQAGNVLEDIGVTMKRREDVIDRVRLMGDFEKWATESLTALETEGLENKAVVDKYAQGLREKVGQVLSQHGGTSGSRAELQAQLTNQALQFEKSAMAAQVKAQHTMIGNFVDQTSNELSLKATMAPSAMDMIFQESDARLAQFEGALSPQMLDQYRQASRSKIATNAISGALAKGQWQVAKSMLANPEVAKVLSPDASRKLGIDVIVDEAEDAAETKRQDENVRRMTLLTGRNLTPEEVVKARTLPPKKDRTPADDIMEWEIVNGTKAPQHVIDKIMGTYIEGGAGASGLFGNSLQGRSLNFVTDNAVAYANGMLGAEQARQFQAAVSEAYKPIERQDPVTGAWTKIQPTIPAFVQQAIQRGDAVYGASMMSQPTPQRPLAGGTPMPGQTVHLDIGGQPVGQAVVDASGRWSIPAPPEAPAAAPAGAPEGQGSIWSRRSNITGVVPAAAELAGRIPVVGEAMGGGGQFATDRQYAEATSRELIRALSQSGRYLASEMQAIENEVSISGSVFDNPEAYARRLIGIDEALARRVADETKILANPSTPLEQRKAAESVINVITNFRNTLGVPQRVKSVEEAKKLPPGTEFIDPNGVVRVVPGR